MLMGYYYNGKICYVLLNAFLLSLDFGSTIWVPRGPKKSQLLKCIMPSGKLKPFFIIWTEVDACFCIDRKKLNKF